MVPWLLSRILPLVGVAALATSLTGRLNGEVFDRYSPVASAHEVARRSLSPATFDRFERYLHTTGHSADKQVIDLASEAFDLYVPPHAVSPRGYGVLVWVAPQEDSPAPAAWLPELDRRGIIYVSARRSGNVHRVLDRRVPLALHAAENVMRRYPVDPGRVYVGGFSGGSRTALKLAVGYPDVFRGALLNAGSDVLGGKELVLPPAELIPLLQERSRLVYVTGVRDMPNKRMDAESRASAKARCLHSIQNLWMPAVEHAPPDARNFSKAMALLDVDSPASIELPACRQRLMVGIEAELEVVEGLLREGKISEAGERLGEVDAQWGGLAAPRSVLLARRISESLNNAEK